MIHSRAKITFRWFFVFGFLASCVLAGTPAYAKRKAPKGNVKYAAIVIEADTGRIFYENNADKPLHPASLTKIMTLLMAFEALDQKRIGLNDNIVMSRHAASMAPSKIGIKPGGTIRVKDAIGVIVTKSANDISAALAEHLGGSEAQFAQSMTQRARTIGMRQTTFVNASGLHDIRQKSSARDMATLARYIITHYPAYYRYFSLQSYNYGGRTYQNHNHLMETYKGMDGMKTGYVVASGFNLVASAVRDHHRLIGVVFGGQTTKSRNTQMAKLLDQGFKEARTLPAAPQIAQATPRPVPSAKSPDTKAQFDSPPSPRIKAPSAKPLLLSENENPVPAPARKPKHLKMPEPAFPREVLKAPSKHPPQMTAKAGYVPAPLEPTTLATIQPSAPAPLLPRDLAASASVPSSASQPVLTRAAFAEPAPPPVPDTDAPWSVQIGAYSSRALTDQNLQKALHQLPAPYAQAQPIIAPLKTAQGWLFRARLTGFTKTEALAACNYLKECLPVAPHN